MPRQIRIEFPGALYHVMARGDRREPIFLDDEDCGSFLKVLAEASHKMGWRIHAYALMVNHYHLVIETPEPNLVKGMTSVQGTYTARFNARHKLRGHVFGGRYKAVVVQHGKGEYFSTLLDYVHLNPVRAKLVKRVDGLDSYPWTSLSFYRKPPSKREPWQVVEKGLAETGQRDTASGRRKFLERLEMKACEQAASGKRRAGRGFRKSKGKVCNRHCAVVGISGHRPSETSSRISQKRLFEQNAGTRTTTEAKLNATTKSARRRYYRPASPSSNWEGANLQTSRRATGGNA